MVMFRSEWDDSKGTLSKKPQMIEHPKWSILRGQTDQGQINFRNEFLWGIYYIIVLL